MVLVIVLLWALERVDYAPYFDTDYYSHTRFRLDSISGQLSLAEGEVEVGFGRESQNEQDPS